MSGDGASACLHGIIGGRRPPPLLGGQRFSSGPGHLSVVVHPWWCPAKEEALRAVTQPSGRALRTPRAAGFAGMIAALLLGAAMVLVRITIPADPTGATSWVVDPSRRDALQVALNFVPFAGIFFLWFMGAVRDYFGEGESRFFATLFLASGLLFVAMLFVLAAAAHGLPASPDAAQDASQLQLVLTLLSSYSTRMAAVFTMATTSIGSGLGLFPRWLVWLGYLVAVVLLFVNIPWSELIFPVWVLVISSYIFQARPDRQSAPSGFSPVPTR